MKKKIEKNPLSKAKMITQADFSYKDPEKLKKFLNQQGSILPRDYTNLSAKLQRRLKTEIKRARHLALLGFTQTLE